MAEPWKHKLLIEKKPDTEDTQYDSIYTKCSA